MKEDVRYVIDEERQEVRLFRDDVYVQFARFVPGWYRNSWKLSGPDSFHWWTEHLRPDEREAYRVARDELIERGLIPDE